MPRELKRIQKELGLTFAFVTHDQDEAMAMADRIAVMHRGRNVQIGTASEPHDAPKTGFIAEFIGDLHQVDGVFAQGWACRRPCSS
ncbi:hypothetical protein AB0929_29570 [Streptomyces massasporeus]|uniref:hypothetical protein n=1 Tax=Streptomyces massasporeus TaxID=67324 RepID=UPI0034540D47